MAAAEPANPWELLEKDRFAPVQQNLDRRGRWERGSGRVLPSQGPHICLEKKFQAGLQMALQKTRGKERCS